MRRSTSVLSYLIVPALLAGCATTDGRVAQLAEENARLRTELNNLKQALQEKSPEELRTIPSFTVGLAASEREFDAAAFERLLDESLDAASQSRNVRVARESDPRQISKVRGMLMQQYLAAEQVPIVITNLTFKIGDPENAFKIGDQIVPSTGLRIARAAAGEAVTATHPGPIPAVMRRDSRGRYSIPYEELGGGSGSIQVQTADVEILESEEKPRAQRQGDISFNWDINLAQIAVYRVENFQGDVGLFLSNMRYSGVQTAIGQYQTLRDVVFLFGYGSYSTRVINQIRTPAHITMVEVAPIDQETFDRLEGRLSEQQVLEIVGDDARWTKCEFVDFSNAEKIWQRPATVPFPFISRQVSGDNEQVFYLKYGSKGAFFIGDYER